VVKTTREQREAIKRAYDCARGDMTYREFRKKVTPTFGCDGAVTVPWCGFWLCIERDGYTHS
jgi:hypothetical protein